MLSNFVADIALMSAPSLKLASTGISGHSLLDVELVYEWLGRVLKAVLHSINVKNLYIRNDC